MMNLGYELPTTLIDSETADLQDWLRQPVHGGFISFREYIARVKPDYEESPPLTILIDVLQHVADSFDPAYLKQKDFKPLKRVLVSMPPREGKSETISRLFPSYFLNRFPTLQVGLSSHTDNLSSDLCLDARTYYEAFGGKLHRSRKGAKRWRTIENGGMWSCGVAGTATGKGYHLGITDDAIKDALQALNPDFLKQQQTWWQTVWNTRQEPGAAQVVLMTRWADDDLIGWHIKQEEESDMPENWHVVVIPAIQTDPPKLPDSCTFQTDGRKKGEIIQGRFAAQTYLKIKENNDPFWFSCLYQQTPSPTDGVMWRIADFRLYDALPFDVNELVNYWDTAYTEDEDNSASAYVSAGTDGKGNVFIDWFDFDYVETPELVDWMKDVEGRHKIENKASGKSAEQFLKKHSIPAELINPPAADKVVKTQFVRPIAKQGHLWVNRKIAYELLRNTKQGLLFFPKKGTDVNDCVVLAILDLTSNLQRWADAMRVNRA